MGAIQQLLISFGAEEGVTYVRTAFLSSTGNDGTAALNDASLPFLTTTAAINALVAAYPDEDTTLRLLDSFDGGGADIGLAARAGTGASLTIQSHADSLINLGGALNCGSLTIDLILDNVGIAALGWEPNTATSSTNAGTINVGRSSTIGQITAEGYSPSAGSNGSEGSTVNGSNGAGGADGDPPSNGNDGETVTSYGGEGNHGDAGGFGRNITVIGPVTIDNISIYGGNGGSGGNGGNGGAATGGTGGTGGNSTSESSQAGGNGGNGGAATSGGGNGGNGGAGGNGGFYSLSSGASVTYSVSVAGGTGGSAGSGGLAGTVTGGSGGSGGNGANGGTSGTSGSNGATYTPGGNSGNPGANGSNGGI